MHQSPDFLPQPLDLSGRAQSAKPLLVLLEQKQCEPCDELHGDILNRPGLQDSLAQFDVALVDVWSADLLTTPDGKRLKSTDWAALLGVYYTPSLVFFDQTGQEVFRADALLKAFHIHAALDYVLSGAYKVQPSFQRFVQTRADAMRAEGLEPNLME